PLATDPQILIRSTDQSPCADQQLEDQEIEGLAAAIIEQAGAGEKTGPDSRLSLSLTGSL
ncbi:hypothetical protein AAHH78_34005, partial [Burkholderia pseudomallei]